MERSRNVSGMHRDDVTRYIMDHLDGITISDGLGNPLKIERPKSGPDISDSWLRVIDHRGHVGTVFVGIGR